MGVQAPGRAQGMRATTAAGLARLSRHLKGEGAHPSIEYPRGLHHGRGMHVVQVTPNDAMTGKQGLQKLR